MSGERERPEDGAGFLSRWSRRKADSRREDPDPDPAPATPTATDPAVGPVPDPVAAPPAVDPADLPDPESLTKESDFAPFLKQGVPEGLRKAALRKLWATDPAWAVPDPLDIHNLDYRLPAAGAVVRSAWKVGKGYLDKAADKSGTADSPDGAAALATEAEPRPLESFQTSLQPSETTSPDGGAQDRFVPESAADHEEEDEKPDEFSRN